MTLFACKDEPEYVKQDQLTIKAIPIKALMFPQLTPDGSLVTFVAEQSNNPRNMRQEKVKDGNNMDTAAVHAADGHDNRIEPNEPTYHLVKLHKDGSITSSPAISFHFGDQTQRAASIDLDESIEGIDFGIDITNDGGVFFKYRLEYDLAVSTLDEGGYIDTVTKSFVEGKFIGCAALDDGSIAVVHGNSASLSIFGADCTLQAKIQLPYFYCDEKDNFKVFNICGNIMIFSLDEKHEFYVYSPAGELLNYGSIPYMFDRIINIVDPATGQSTHSYATTDVIQYIDASGEIQKACILTKLDYKGNVIYYRTRAEHTRLLNVIEQDGKLITAGYYVAKSYDEMNTFREGVSAITAMKGKISTIDAETGDEIDVTTISLDGGVLPYAAVPDGNGNYDVYMTRIFSSNLSNMDDIFNDAIYIYHIDDLKKLEME